MRLTISNRASQYLIAAVALFGIAPFGLAATTLTLVSAGNNFIEENGLDVYVGPYIVSIGGTSVDAICLDYQGDPPSSNPSDPTTWTAAPVSPASDAIIQQQATLAAVLLSGSCVGACAAELQYAIWYLADPTALSNLPSPPSAVDVYGGTSTTLAHFVSDVKGIAGVADIVSPPYVGPKLTVYTADGTTSLQKFITFAPPTSVPEPPSLSVLGLDLSAVGAIVFFLRRRIIS